MYKSNYICTDIQYPQMPLCSLRISLENTQTNCINNNKGAYLNSKRPLKENSLTIIYGALSREWKSLSSIKYFLDNN